MARYRMALPAHPPRPQVFGKQGVAAEWIACLWPPPVVGTGSISASASGSRILTAACFDPVAVNVDRHRVHKLITEDIPDRVAADSAYQNAKKNSDKQNARIEHDKALARVMTAVLKDDTELFKQFMDNESLRRWMTDTVFGLTYQSVEREA